MTIAFDSGGHYILIYAGIVITRHNFFAFGLSIMPILPCNHSHQFASIYQFLDKIISLVAVYAHGILYILFCEGDFAEQGGQVVAGLFARVKGEGG